MEEGAADEAIERLAVPLVLIDGVGRVRQGNTAARLLAEGIDGLEVAPGSALFRHPFEQRLLMAATATASRPGGRRLGRMTVRRDEGRPVDLLVARLAISEGPAAAFAVLLFDPVGEPTPATALARAHGLAGRESDLVARILLGGDVTAERQGPGGRRTPRSPLGRLLAKLGTTRQADLVRLLLAGVVELRP